MAVSMRAKRSSVSTISAASLATSVPDWPIATPTSAFLRAGASLTPSPTIAVTLPASCSTETMVSLSLGVVRAKTSALRINCRRFSSDRPANCAPVTAFGNQPVRVFGNRDGSFWMITSNHFHLHASAAHLLDGRDDRLTRRVDNRGDAEKIKSFAEQFRVISVVAFGTTFSATAMTRWP